jgi:hypothetical protein
LIFDDTDDIAGQHRLVHRRGLDQCQLLCVDRGEIRLRRNLAVQAFVDELAQVALEIRDQLGAFFGEHVAGIQAKRLLFTDIGTLGAGHEQVADAIEHRRKRQQQSMDGEIPAIAENSRHILGQRTADCPFARGRRHVHAFGPLSAKRAVPAAGERSRIRILGPISGK